MFDVPRADDDEERQKGGEDDDDGFDSQPASTYFHTLFIIFQGGCLSPNKTRKGQGQAAIFVDVFAQGVWCRLD